MAELDWIENALKRYEVPLIRYATSLVSDLDRARDVVQDTFLRLCRQDPEKIKDHMAQWLFRVCRNRALDFHRRDKRMELLDTHQAGLLKDPSQGPSERLELREKWIQVEDALRRLTDNQQEVVRLKFQSGLSYREISEITGLSVSNVGFLLHTAIKKVRSKLNPDSHRGPQIRRVK